MPIARFELPDGRIGRFEVPDGTTPEQAQDLISSQFDDLIPAEEKDKGGSIERFLEGGGRAVTQRGIGLIQRGIEGIGAVAEMAGYDSPFPETYAASQRSIEKLRKEGEGTGFAGGLGEALADPINLALAPMGVGRGALGLMKAGAFGGGLTGATSGTKEGESALTNSLSYGAMGAMGAPILSKAGELTGAVVSPVADKVIRGAKRILPRGIADDMLIGVETSGRTTYDDFANAIAGLGDDAINSFQSGVKQGLSPRQAYVAAKAKSQGVNLTRGQLTQDPNLQRLEDLAQQGVLSDKAKLVATQNTESNEAATRAWADKLRTQLAGDNPVDDTSVASTLTEAVKAKAAQMKAPVDAAYKFGATTTAKAPASEFVGITGNIRKDLTESGFDVGAMPVLQRTLSQMNKAERILAKAGQANYKPFEVFRKRLVQNVENASTPAEKAALRRVRDQYTAKLEDVITNKLIDGGDEAARVLRSAPALHAEYRQSFFGRDGKAALGKIVEKDMTDRQVADLFGSGVLGKAPTQRVVQQLKSTLGEQSPEMGQVRGMFLNRLFKGALTDGDTIGQQKFGVALNTQWRKFKTQNKALVNELYTPEMQREIDDFVAAAYLQSARNASKTNPSGSGIVVLDGAARLFERLGGSGLASEAVRMIGKKAVLNQSSNQAINAVTNPFRDLGNTRMITDALRNVGRVGGIQSGGSLPEPPTIEGQSPTRMTINPAMQGREGVPDVNLPQVQGNAGSILDRIAYAESRGNPTAQAATSSAFGIHQYTKDTWREAVKKYGREIGVNMKDIANPQAQYAITQALIEREYVPALSKVLGRTPDDGEIYLAHFAGVGGAKRLLRAPDNAVAARLLPKAAAANPSIFYDGKKPRRVSDVIQIVAGKVS